MRKLIVITSAVLTLIFAIGMIVLSVWFGIKDASSSAIIFFILLAIFLPIILISSLVLLNIKLNLPFRILGAILAIGIGLISVALFIVMTIMFIQSPELPALFPIYCLGFVAIFITLFTYIRRALKPTEVKENK
jgi:amino acid transporter